VCFDENGMERTDDRDVPGGRFSDKVIAALAAEPKTDLFLFSHGWTGTSCRR
jgi:hypothetical protein